MTISHVIGFDDTPFARGWRGDVPVIGAVFAGPCLEGVLRCKVRRDGVNATTVLIDTLMGSRFFGHLQAVFLQGIAVAGFNVIDIQKLHARTRLPVVVVCRKSPDLVRIRTALLNSVKGGRRKWKLIEKAGPMEPLENVFVQRAGISLAATAQLLQRFAINGQMPEPLRTAHIIAGGITTGESRHRA